MNVNWKKVAIAAIAFLTTVAVIDDTNIVGQVARKAIDVIATVFGIAQ